MSVSLGNYLFTRFKQLGVGTIFGVPGDFNLRLLDKIYEVDGLRWAGNANELNAGYAADGYSRIKRLSCLVTTFGVGELSALAAVAGSYAEHVGLVHVVGIPSTDAQNEKLLLHHTLGNGDFTVFRQMSEKISRNTYVISDPEKAAAVIDEAIRNAYVYQRPIYLAIPANKFDITIDKSLLETPVDLSIPPNNKEEEAEVIETVVEMIKKAQHPIILVDACARRHDVIAETEKIAKITHFPLFCTPMGKGLLDERLPQFGGVYVGSLSDPEVAKIVESSDLILSVGALLSDFNTGSFSYHYNTRNLVEFHSDHIKVRSATYNGVGMKALLSNLSNELLKHFKPVPEASRPALPHVPSFAAMANKDEPILQKWMWTRLSAWLREGDIVITETGTSSFGILKTKFPKNVIGISQVLWGSIGYSVGSTCGAALAAQEIDPKKRVILFVGDGSLQLTVQEISTMIRWNSHPYLFILNNNGYTIERLIHGKTASYNDVHMWKYSKLLDVFNAKDGEAIQVKTQGEFDNLLTDSKFAEPSRIRTIEVFLPQMDAPENLVKQAEMSASLNG